MKHSEALVSSQFMFFNGKAPPLKKLEKDVWKKGRDKKGEVIRKSAEEFNSTGVLSDADLEDIMKSRRGTSMAHPTVCDHLMDIDWMKEAGIECYGSPYEADYQLVKLEKGGIIDATNTEDGDLVILGGKLVLAKMSRKNGLKFRVYGRDEFISNLDRYHSKLAKYPSLWPMISIFLGNVAVFGKEGKKGGANSRSS